MSALDDLLDEHKAKIERLEAELTEGNCITRRDYIREAAMLLYIHGRSTSNGHEAVSRDEAWVKARGLWDAKPEDC